MHPPWSMIIFTTLAGTAQGLLLALVGLEWAAPGVPATVFTAGALAVLALGAAGLAAATFHLGHPLRAWRAVAMWRTSWLSREVIVLPLFLAVVAAWGLVRYSQPASSSLSLSLGALASVLALVLYLCTSMIYAAVKAIRQWAHPITPINFLVLGLASGFLLAAALAAAAGEGAGAAVSRPLAWAAAALTVLGACTRAYAWHRNLRTLAQPKTTLQSALGIRHRVIEQQSQGAMAGSFNTREFFHGQTEGFAQRMRWAAVGAAFVVPALLLALGARGAAALSALFLLQLAGLLCERWSFFAEGQHTQNLYQRRMG